MRNEPGEKKSHVKKGGVPEPTNRLRNRHGPMEAQRCLGAKTNSPRMFALVSCFKLSNGQTSFRTDFVQNDVISVRSSILFEVYRGLSHGMHFYIPLHNAREQNAGVLRKHFQKLKLKLKKHLWLKTLKEKVKRITIVKGVCTAYEKSTTAQTNSTNVLHMKRQNMAAAHLWIFHGLIVSMKDDKIQFSSHYTKILPESKAKNKQTKNKQNKSTKQKKPQSKRKAQNQNKNSKLRKNKEQKTTQQSKSTKQKVKHKTTAKAQNKMQSTKQNKKQSTKQKQSKTKNKSKAMQIIKYRG